MIFSERRKEDATFVIKASYLEIYNEKARVYILLGKEIGPVEVFHV